MAKHILDGARTRSETARAAHFARIETRARPRPQSKALQRKPGTPAARLSARRFLDSDAQT